jgi:hypothetical protein
VDVNEATMLSRVVDQVHLRSPGSDRQEIEQLVAGLFRDYADSRVRSYLPIFVERDALQALRSRQAQTV